MVDEGCFYVTKSKWKITSLLICKFVIIKVKETVWKIKSLLNKSKINPFHQHLSVYDAEKSIIRLLNIFFCLCDDFDKFIYLFNENILSDFLYFIATFIIQYFIYFLSFLWSIYSTNLWNLLFFEWQISMGTLNINKDLQVSMCL